jgi:ABC-type branched-subunit amino acid transport system substrate-binding protein
MINLRKLTITALAFSLIASCQFHSAANAAEPGVTNDEILIGSCCALSGPASGLGNQQLTGASAYISYINENGGVNGRKIKIQRYDDGYDPAKAPTAFQKLVQDKCFAGTGFVGTPPAKVYVPLAEKNEVPIVGFFTGAAILQEPFHKQIFSVRASYLDEMRAQVDHMWKDLGPQKVAIIYQNDPFGNPGLAALKPALTKYGAAPVAYGSFERNTTDVTDAINKVKAANPDVVVMVGPYAPLAEVVKRSHAMGWRPLFTTTAFVGTEEFIQAAGKDAEGTVITQVVSPYNRDDLATVTLYKRLLHTYFPEQKPTFCSFEGFVDAMVLVEGLKRAGKDLTRAKLISALESIHDKDMGLGPILKLTYDSHRHKGFDSVYTTVVRDGEPVAFISWKQLKQK